MLNVPDYPHLSYLIREYVNEQTGHLTATGSWRECGSADTHWPNPAHIDLHLAPTSDIIRGVEEVLSLIDSYLDNTSGVELEFDLGFAEALHQVQGILINALTRKG